MTTYLSELFHGINKAKSRKDKKLLLAKYKTNNILKYFLVGAFDPNIEWDYGGIIPEWKKDIRIMLEVPGFFGKQGFRYINGRQTELLLVGPKQEGLND